MVLCDVVVLQYTVYMFTQRGGVYPATYNYSDSGDVTLIVFNRRRNTEAIGPTVILIF